MNAPRAVVTIGWLLLLGLWACGGPSADDVAVRDERPAEEATAEVCGDGRDNDGDRRVDCDDADCRAQQDCVTCGPCDRPPAGRCVDARVLESYLLPGRCIEGRCSYSAERRPCAHGCVAGRCADLPPAPCDGVICDDPPPPRCEDDDTLLTADPLGSCLEGSCRYVRRRIPCPGGCVGEPPVCEGDPCAAVTCDEPPRPRCEGEAVLLTYEAAGRCESGQCRYAESRIDCAWGCDAAHSQCRPDPCGNGALDAGESCDTAIAAGRPGACPEDCAADDDPCVVSVALVDPGSCAARCEILRQSACSAGDGCCPLGCMLSSDADCAPEPSPPCSPGSWTDDRSGALVAEAGLGVREPPAAVIYGQILDGGAVVLPRCAYFSGTVRLPVLMVGWNDFDPVSDPSNRNNPQSIHPTYQQTTPAELAQWLNGEEGPAQYFRDVSGGRADLVLQTFDWIEGGTGGTYLQQRAAYEHQPWLPENDRWVCRRDEVFADALRDAVVRRALDLRDYDADQNGFVDGAVLVYEGAAGLCSGTNMSWLEGSNHPRDHLPIADLVPASDPNHALFVGQTIKLQYYNNLPDGAYHPADPSVDAGAWVHELGHLLLGFPDTYDPRFTMGGFALSASGKSPPTHPAAWEKWLYARWIEPATVAASGSYTLQANEIPAGTRHDRGTYLLEIHPDGDPTHFLTVENRWFDESGLPPQYTGGPSNTAARWASYHNRESGLQIVEFRLDRSTFDRDPPQLRRHEPARDSVSPLHLHKAWRLGDRFSACFTQRCVTIEPTSDLGSAMTLSVQLTAP